MKKKAAKKKAPVAKRKYQRRTVEEMTGGGDEQSGLLTIEKYDTIVTKNGFRWTEEYRKMEQLIKSMKVKEGFIIKAEWKGYPHRIVADLELPITIRLLKVIGNDKVRRVVRFN